MDGGTTPTESEVDVKLIGSVDQQRIWRAAGDAADGLVVVWGGLEGDERDPVAVEDGWIVRTDRETVTPTTASGLAGRSDHVATFYDGEVYVWGGTDKDGNVLRNGAVLDPYTNEWREMSYAPVGLESPQAVVDGDRILIVGRRQDNREESTLLIYTPSADSWEAVELGVLNRLFELERGWLVARLCRW